MWQASAVGAVPFQDEGRVPWVDYAKGLCIIAVVMMHSTLGVEEAVGETGWLHVLVAFARPFRMPDFFLISGLFLSRVIDRDWRTYLDRKVAHFAYFYVLWVVILWAVKGVYPAYAAGHLTDAFSDLARAVWDPPGSLWFIYELPLFFVATKLLRRMHPLLLLGVALTIQAIPYNFGILVIDEFCERWFFFLVGVYAAPYIFRFASIVGERVGLALAGLAAWALVNGGLVYLELAHHGGIRVVLGLAGAMAVITISVLIWKADILKLVRYAGQRSLMVYLAFPIPMAITRLTLLDTGIVPDIGTICLIVTAMGVSVPLILHRLVKDGRLRFLFERPDWAYVAMKKPLTSQARMVPAE
jgi:uncharacterized membrane protein YcfT